MGFKAGGMNSRIAEEAGNRFGVALENLLTVITTGLGGGRFS